MSGLAPVSSITVRRRLMATNVGLRPTPRLGRLRGPQRPAPLPRRRARVRAQPVTPSGRGRLTNVGLRPTPRLGRLQGPQRPAPLPRRRARPRAARYAAPVCRRAVAAGANEYEILVSPHNG